MFFVFKRCKDTIFFVFAKFILKNQRLLEEAFETPNHKILI